MSDTLYIDFHTHHPSREGEYVVQDGVHTWGIHPWQAHLPRFCPKDERGFDTYPNDDATNPEELFSDKAKALGISPNDDAMHFPAFFPKDRGQLMAIGECGLDANAEASLEVQSRLLRAQLQFSMHWQLPVILHCVKQLDPLIALRKEYRIIAEGSIRFLERENDEILAYERELEGEHLLVLCNFRASDIAMPELHAAGEKFIGNYPGMAACLRPYEVVALRWVE